METQVKLTKLSSCAGCGAKVGAGTLAKLLGDLPTHTDPNLLVGFDRSDDASVYRVSNELALVQTVDFFPPIVDDPFTFGQIAAANALSDVYAMGGEPKLALNLLCIPEKMPQSAVQSILAGGYSKAYEAGAIITGGHSIFDDVPKYGLCVTGFVHPDKFYKNLGAREGDVLFLTKPLGAGILTTAEKAEMLEPGEIERVIQVMATLNKGARDCAVNYRVHACTDVTGFSLMGHMLEMMQGSETSARVETAAVDFLPRVLEFANMGLLPAGVYRNRAFAEPFVEENDLPLPVRDALFDPQTSGGLLIAVDPGDADALERDLRASVPSAQRIGTVIAKAEKSIYLI
ncbi:MAG: selenide, water dikinase SelD [Eubacteriales bacterium]|nr:selenide, water dikinase SelD [Eubacteriales bacterium]